MIKLIASDLDGTLLQNGALELNPEVFKLILQLKEHGILFTAASGRQLHSLKYLFRPIKDDISYIAENGSICIHNIISHGIIDRNLVFDILKAAKEYDECHLLLSCKSRCYTTSKDPRFIRYMKENLYYDIAYVEDVSSLKEPFLKLAFCDFKGTKNLLPYFQNIFQNRIHVVTAGNIWVDFIAPGANKGTALKALAESLHIIPEEIIAFGDQYNDIEMLQFAGSSYAMASAAPGVADYATHITDSVEKILVEILAKQHSL